MPPGTLWIDLHHPTPEEERLLESHLQVNIPTREEMAEIEDSSRFYEDGNVLYMTTSVVGGITEHRPSTEEVTFVLSEKWLITVRYADLRSFREFENRCIRQLDANRSSTQLFALMMDSLVDRIADVLEAVQGQLSSMSREIFAESTAQTRKPKTDLQQIIKHLGRSSSLLSKLNDSLLSINRMNSYFRQGCNGWLSEPAKVLAKTVERDVRSLDEYLAKMSTEINFLLDATLGLINIRAEQHHQGVLHRCRTVPAADPGGHGLRHELQGHARAGLVHRLSDGAGDDGGIGDPSVPLVQVQELALRHSAGVQLFAG